MAKTYIEGSSAKAIQWQFWEFFNISFNIEKLKQYANEQGYVNLTMSKRREVGQYGDTHYFTLNEYKPSNNNSMENNQQKETWTLENSEWISVEDVPF